MHFVFSSLFILRISLDKLAALGLVHGILHLRVLFLQLQEETWILDFHKVVDILQSGLHERNLRLHAIVPEGDALADGVLRACHEVTGQQLDEFVLYVLNKVQFGGAIAVHDENSQEGVRLFDARIYHFNQNVYVVLKFNHKLLIFLHVSKRILVDDVSVVEE